MEIVTGYGIGLCVDFASGYKDSVRQLECLFLGRSMDGDSYLDCACVGG